MEAKIIARIVCAACLFAAANISAQVINPPPYSPQPPPPVYAPPAYPYPPPSPYQYGWQPWQWGPFYLQADAGGVILQDVHLKNIGTTAHFDTGVRGDIAFGYHVVAPFSVEFETGVLWNRMDVNNQPLFTVVDHADLYQIPFLANLVFHVPLNNGVSFYIGGGCGGVASELDVNQPLSNGFFTIHRHAYDTSVAFGFQGKAGINFQVGPNMVAGVAYKFMGTLDNHWFANDPSLDTQSSPLYSHSILGSFTWTF